MTQNPLHESLMTSAVGVLGSMLIDETAVAPMLMAVSEHDFQTTEQRTVYRAIADLYNAGSSVDAILVADRLGDAYRQYLADLIEATPTSANADAYAAELKRTSRLMQLQTFGAAIANADNETEVQALIDKANLLFCERQDVRRLSMEQAFRAFFTRKNGKGEDYLTWGITGLDGLLHVTGGDMVVIGGRPSAGKTAFALQLAFHIAQTKRVGFFSYETSADKLYDRTVACQTHTSFRRIMQDVLRVEDYRRIRDHQANLTKPQLEFLETSGMTVSEISSYTMAHHYDVIFVDYLQKIPVPKSNDAFQRVSQVSDALQQLARRTGKTVIALSQLRRGASEDAPTMADLRESGQIEQDADVILLLYREDKDDPRCRRVLDVAKNKDGEPGCGILLDFDGDKQWFTQGREET